MLRWCVFALFFGSLAQIDWVPKFSFPRTDLSRDICDGRAERGEAVQDGDTDLELRDLTVSVARGQALTQ
jgi:hypothetical protein